MALQRLTMLLTELRCIKQQEVGGDEPLLTILAASDVEEVVSGGIEHVSEADRVHLELVAAQSGSAREHGDVAAVGVDVQVLGIEMPDADPHDRCSSQ